MINNWIQLSVVLAVVIILSGIGSCTYQLQVALPLRMAEKGMCWRQIDIVNEAPQWYWAPCNKTAESPKP